MSWFGCNRKHRSNIVIIVASLKGKNVLKWHTELNATKNLLAYTDKIFEVDEILVYEDDKAPTLYELNKETKP